MFEEAKEIIANGEFDSAAVILRWLSSSGLTPWPPSGGFKDKGYIVRSVQRQI